MAPSPSPSSLTLSPSVLTSACSHRGPGRRPGPSWPHAPAPGQVEAEHPAGRPLPVPGSRAAGGEAGECLSRCAMAPSQQRTGAALTTDTPPRAPGLPGHFTLTAVGTCSTGPLGSSVRPLCASELGPHSPARPLVSDHPDAEGVPGAPGAARAAGTAGRPVHPPPDDKHQRAGEPWPQVQARVWQEPKGPSILSSQTLIAEEAVAVGCSPL